ncbi:alpha/beta hydrolase [Beggiatoa leptomitoformis]|uniref:Alpha/beta fold hydrolase n=1 Tax=Beggiatoa leptomitoformis TaxID=288004 RepID=A0A2N9YH40_9GAMM|nr:alpha/beta fold hydrolase [Beggiatoa leptomitoformis]ALG67997.1 alpha/beta fold hydrolase [Beggiatoa leptomitoformis]AUI69719.1 alpha/beta fold hydrolase [Beggiatoa leptomitoformis]
MTHHLHHHCKPQQLLIPAPAGQLEVQMSCPKHPQDPSHTPYIVVCHPNPVQGGAMTNKVVYMLASTFNAMGLGVVRFNFRGVGKSTGTYDHGDGETDDLRAVVQWLKTEYAPTELWLAGFSFGSYVALRAHEELGAKRLLLVAPAVGRFNFENLKLSNIPTMIIQGGQDEVIVPDDVLRWMRSQSYQPQLHWMDEADHFFHSRLNELRDAIIDKWGRHLV